MAARYSRIPNEDPELGGDGDRVAFDFSSAYSYGMTQDSLDNYKSIFSYSNKEKMRGSDLEVTVIKQSFGSVLCGHVITAMTFLLLLVTFPISAWKCFKIVSDTDKLVVFRLGRLQGAKGPGLVFINPCIDRVKKVDMRIKAFNVPPLQLITLDAGIIEMGADVYYNISDAIKSITSVQDLNMSLRAIVRNTLMNHLVKYDLSDIEAHKWEIINSVLTSCKPAADGWGVDISKIELSPIKILQEAKTGASLPPGLGGEQGMSSMFQQLAACLMNNGPTAAGPQVQVIDESTAASGAAVGCGDIHVSTGPSPRDILQVVKGVLSETLVRSVDAVYQFRLSGPNGGMYYMDLKHGSGQVGEGPDPRNMADVTLDLSVSDMQQMFTGNLAPLQAYMNGRLKVSGDLSAAMRLEEVMNKVISKTNNSSVAGYTVINI